MELSAHTGCNNLWTGSRVTILGNPGQIGGGGGKESLNGPKYMTRRKVKNDSARLDFSLPPINAPGSPRMTSDIKQLI